MIDKELDDAPPDAPEEEDGDDGDSDFSYLYCCDCGIEFGIPRHLYDQRHRDGRNFYCPNGHCQHFGESDAVKAQRAQQEALAAKSRSEQLEAKLESMGVNVGTESKWKWSWMK